MVLPRSTSAQGKFCPATLPATIFPHAMSWTESVDPRSVYPGLRVPKTEGSLSGSTLQAPARAERCRVENPPCPRILFLSPLLTRISIEITDDYVAWTRRPVDQINYHRLKRTLWPVAVASGTLASTQYLWHVKMNQLREWFGLRPKVDPTIDVLARHLEAMQRAKQAGSNRPLAPPPHTSERTVASTNTNTSTNTGGKTAAAAEKFTEFEPIPPQSIAMSIFSTTLLKNWKTPQLEAPRGTIIVTGLIEIRGDKARTVLDVAAAYDPLIDKYVVLRVGSRLIQDKQQRPRGGR